MYSIKAIDDRDQLRNKQIRETLKYFGIDKTGAEFQPSMYSHIRCGITDVEVWRPVSYRFVEGHKQEQIELEMVDPRSGTTCKVRTGHYGIYERGGLICLIHSTHDYDITFSLVVITKE